MSSGRKPYGSSRNLPMSSAPSSGERNFEPLSVVSSASAGGARAIANHKKTAAEALERTSAAVMRATLQRKEAAQRGFMAYGLPPSAFEMSAIAFCARTLFPAASSGGETTAMPNF